MLSDDLLKGVKDHVLVLADALRNISKYDFEALIKNTERVVFSFQADSIQDRRNDERKELLAILSDMPDNIHNAFKYHRMMINQG